jgi:hypothetical protein
MDMELDAAALKKGSVDRDNPGDGAHALGAEEGPERPPRWGPRVRPATPPKPPSRWGPHLRPRPNRAAPATAPAPDTLPASNSLPLSPSTPPLPLPPLPIAVGEIESPGGDTTRGVSLSASSATVPIRIPIHTQAGGRTARHDGCKRCRPGVPAPRGVG